MATSIGLISDTHGLLRPEASEALHGSDLIIHAGDVGKPEILEQLRRLAPVVAVRGNIDRSAWARELPEAERVIIGGKKIYVLHILGDLDFNPAEAGFAAVIHGHSHKPKIEEKQGVLFINPGSAGPRRFHLPVTLGRLTLADGRLRPELIWLEV